MPKYRLGSMDHQCFSADAPLGPQSVQELYDWPTFVIHELCDSRVGADSRLRRLRAISDGGILGSSEFSGWDSQAEATRCCSQALGAFCGEPSRGFLWVRSCDYDELPRKVLCQMSELDHGFACVHGDINDRLPDTVISRNKAIHRSILQQLPPPIPWRFWQILGFSVCGW